MSDKLIIITEFAIPTHAVHVQQRSHSIHVESFLGTSKLSKQKKVSAGRMPLAWEQALWSALAAEQYPQESLLTG